LSKAFRNLGSFSFLSLESTWEPRKVAIVPFYLSW
jgi:hypothetical protein